MLYLDMPIELKKKKKVIGLGYFFDTIDVIAPIIAVGSSFNFHSIFKS